MSEKTVIVYSKPTCMQCNFTKKFLEDHGIAFEVRDVSVSEEAKAEIKALGFKGLPVVIAPGMDAFQGFRPEVLETLA